MPSPSDLIGFIDPDFLGDAVLLGLHTVPPFDHILEVEALAKDFAATSYPPTAHAFVEWLLDADPTPVVHFPGKEHA